MSILDEELVQLYKEMAELTLPKCKQCRAPLSCCSPEYCDMARDFVRAQRHPKLLVLETDHPTLRYMGKDGCVCPPHLRPLCTLHVCSINSLGFDPLDPEFNDKYFALRDKICLVSLEIEARGR